MRSIRELFVFTYLMSLSQVENSKTKEICVYADMDEIGLFSMNRAVSEFRCPKRRKN
jgi:aspartyl aminopeptidase